MTQAIDSYSFLLDLDSPRAYPPIRHSAEATLLYRPTKMCCPIKLEEKNDQFEDHVLNS